MTLLNDGMLYVKPLMNASRRGGVAIGSRVQQGLPKAAVWVIRTPEWVRHQAERGGLTAIAIVKRSITMRKRFDMDRLARNTLVPIVISSIAAELARSK